MPFATSFIVPSPPQAMIKLRPAFAARSAISTASPCDLVNATAKGPKWALMSAAVPDQLSRVEPAADFGLTITSGSVVSDGFDFEVFFAKAT